MPRTDPLQRYREKRDFRVTREPPAKSRPKRSGAAIELGFVIQKHAARRLHYDLRLELDGALKSWAVPKGPSLDPDVKRMALHVEDHPLDYADFEGTIPPKQYGAGTVIVWDRGTWVPEGDPRAGYRDGKLKFELRGRKLHGRWTLVRMHGHADERHEPWLLIKERDAFARPEDEYSVVEAEPGSVLAGTRRNEPPPQARAAPLPETLTPQLATLVDTPPESGAWSWEMKFDGYRLLARVDGDDVRLVTRNGHDWTARMPSLADALAALELPPAWLDGEIVVANEQGVPDFQQLQNAFDSERTDDIVYYVFDLPYCDGFDLRPVPLRERRALLRRRLDAHPSERVRFSEDFSAAPEALLRSACALGMEGLIGKRVDSTYVSRRSPSWIKLKCTNRQEFVIGGYTDPQGSRSGFGALLLGVHDAQGALRYVGKVGTGFDEARLRDLASRLKSLETATSPFAERVHERGAHWVRPELVAEVSYTRWTNDGRIRHSVFHGLRDDKPAATIRREPMREAATSDSDEPTGDDAANGTDASKPAAEAKGSRTGRGGRDGAGTKGARDGRGGEHVKGAKDGKGATDGKDANGRAKGANDVGGAAGALRTPGAGGAKRGSARATTSDSGAPAGVRVTNPERIIDPSTGITKLEVVRYYARAAPVMMPHLRRRPVALVRTPEGIDGPRFFQKHASTSAMPGVRSLDPKYDPGEEPLIEIATEKGLVTAAQMNAIEFHTWNATTRAIEKPDRMIFDLDPGEGVEWPAVREAAQLVRVLLDELALRSFLKTSGGKGLHLVVPLTPKHGWDTVKGLSKAIVVHLARTLPSRFVAKSGPANRKGRIFADFLRNGRGATTVAAWSTRGRPGIGVSVPVAWEELDEIDGGAHWTLRTVEPRLEAPDPWADYASTRQTIDAAMRALDFDAPGE
ncbi:MAG TPA: non-homologous end-joining DNA ligase [Zeimonas sp.]|nr:non-homologous end-joining DNA ligase [Zeimonas sp.]